MVTLANSEGPNIWMQFIPVNSKIVLASEVDSYMLQKNDEPQEVWSPFLSNQWAEHFKLIWSQGSIVFELIFANHSYHLSAIKNILCWIEFLKTSHRSEWFLQTIVVTFDNIIDILALSNLDIGIWQVVILIYVSSIRQLELTGRFRFWKFSSGHGE